MLILRVAHELRRVDRVRDRRALLRGLGRDDRQVRKTGRCAVDVGAVDLVVDVLEEQRRGADDREVLAARLDERVARVGVGEVRVEEVDDDLAAREPALLVDVLREALHRGGRALEEARLQRVVDVRDDADVDLGGRDADLGRHVRLTAPLGACNDSAHAERHRDDGDERHPTRSHHAVCSPEDQDTLSDESPVRPKYYVGRTTIFRAQSWRNGA